MSPAPRFSIWDGLRALPVVAENLSLILLELRHMSAALDRLTASTSAAVSAMNSATTTLGDVAAALRAAAPEDPAALGALADQLDGASASLTTAATDAASAIPPTT